jgi:solute:Na+ symporter, SSS family
MSAGRYGLARRDPGVRDHRMDALIANSTPVPVPVLAVFGWPDWLVLGAYLAAMIVIGFAAARRNQNTEEYFLAERSMPTWALAISVVGSSLSAATFVGVPDLAYKGNLSYLAVALSGSLAAVIVAVLFVPRLYRAGTVTVYGYLSRRYGEPARVAVSLMFLFGRMLASGSRLFIAAFPLCLLLFARRGQSAYEPTGGQLILAICMIGLIGTFYTVAGGIRTVIWIDVIQFAIVAGAAVLSVVLLLRAIPLSTGELFAALSKPSPELNGHSKLQVFNFARTASDPYTVWAALFGSTLLNVAALGVDQDLAQRFLVSKSARKGGLSLIWSQLIGLVTVSCFLLIGLLLHVFYRRPDLMGEAAPASLPGEQAAYPTFLLNELPPVLSGLAIAGFFAIAQGSMDSAANALASSAVADIYLPLRRLLGRPVDPSRSTDAPKIAVALMGLTMTLFAVACVALYDKNDRTLIDFALGVMAFAFTGMLGVFLTALLTGRGNNASVLAALVAGAATVALLQPPVLSWLSQRLAGTEWKLASTWWMPVGTAVAFLVCVAGRSRRAVHPEFGPGVPASSVAD